MKVDLLPEDVSINIGHLIEAGGSPVDIILPSEICNQIQFENLYGTVDSYPIFKNGECYDLHAEVNPQMTCVCFGDEKHWRCSLTNLVYPLAMRLKNEYDIMEAHTKAASTNLLNEVREGEEYECLHSLSDLYVEELNVDTDAMTVEMVLGS